MKQAILLDQAEADLDEIWWYIAQDSPVNADRFIDSILDECHNTLAQFPESGKSCDELLSNLRMLSFDNYLIFYQPVANNVEIVRVLHAARDIKALF